MYRPTKPKVFEPRNPEYALIDSMVSEKFSNYSPEILWWSFLRDGVTGAAPRDELDKVYGEKSSVGYETYDGPFEVKAVLELQPIIPELTRLGLIQKEEMECFANVAALDFYLGGRIPKGGDIFRVAWILTEAKRKYTFYTISNVTPVDPYNFKYINWHIHAEQTTMHEAPESIKHNWVGE